MVVVVVQFCDATTAVQTKEAQEIQFLALLLIAVCFLLQWQTDLGRCFCWW